MYKCTSVFSDVPQVVGTAVPSGHQLLYTSNAKNIIPSEVTFNVHFVDFTPGTMCSIFWPWSSGHKCLTDSQHQVRGIVYIVASLHQHSECVYLGKPQIYKRFISIINL